MGLRREHRERQEALKTRAFPVDPGDVDVIERDFPSVGGLRFYRDFQLCLQQRVYFFFSME